MLCFAHATSRGDVSMVLYDATTLYFEAEKEDELRRVGYSKERRVDPQIVGGQMVDRCGFSAGDRLLRRQQGRDGHHRPDLRLVVGARVTNASIDLASHFHWHGDAFADG
jgi:hypothetical protein